MRLGEHLGWRLRASAGALPATPTGSPRAIGDHGVVPRVAPARESKPAGAGGVAVRGGRAFATRPGGRTAPATTAISATRMRSRSAVARGRRGSRRAAACSGRARALRTGRRTDGEDVHRSDLVLPVRLRAEADDAQQRPKEHGPAPAATTPNRMPRTRDPDDWRHPGSQNPLADPRKGARSQFRRLAERLRGGLEVWRFQRWVWTSTVRPALGCVRAMD